MRKHFYFSGRVQGVGFRYKAQYFAKRMGLTGWVKNLWDGRVEMKVQGDEAMIGRLVSWLKDDTYIIIQDMEEEIIPEVQERSFGVMGF